jgi:hypothetical protein
MRDYSDGAKEQLYATSYDDRPVLLVEIDHEDLAEPIRVVQDNKDLDHKGNTFQAMGFRARLPDEPEKGEARARLAVDNIGRELVQWLEASQGGAGATARFIQVRRSDPNTIEHEVTMDLANVEQTPLEVSAELTFNSLVNQPGIAVRYTPETAPGLF